MQCRSVLTRIDALRTGELASHDEHEVGAHLSTCRSCRASVDDVEDFASAVRSLKSEPPRSLATQCCEAVSDAYDVVEVGSDVVRVAFTPAGVKRVDYGAIDDAAFRASYRKRFGRDLRREAMPTRFRKAIEKALQGKSGELPPIDLSSVGEFQKAILETLRTIPRGEVRSYQWLARAAGRPGAVRAVATAMSSNPVPILLPCHRVVPSSGGFGEYAFGSAMKRRLLEAEDVPVEELERLAKAKVRFIGSRTTKIFCEPSCHDAQRIREENRVPFRDARAASAAGFRPCRHCTPVAA